MLLQSMGLAHLDTRDLYSLLLIAICASFAIGWIMDLIMRNVGFGAIGNSIVSLLGIGAGLALYQRTYGNVGTPNVFVLLTYIVGTVMATLVLCSNLRRFLKL